MASSSPASPNSSGRAAGPSAEYERRAFISKPARVLGWVLIAIAVANFVDLALRGRDHASLVAAASVLFACGVVYVLCLRPGVIADGAAVLVRNPVRDARVPWRDVRKVDVTDALRVHAAERVYRSWAIQETSRSRARKPRVDLPERVAEAVAGRSHSEYVAAQLTEMAGERAADTDERPSVVWSVPAVAALVVPAVLLVVALLV